LLPSTTPRSQLYAQGKLPEYALFGLTPPQPAYPDITPPLTPTNLAEIFALGFGARNLIQNSYRFSYLQDAQENPDGGFPTLSMGIAAATPGLAWRQALQMNDLRNWIPTVPVLLCGGDVDPIVFWLNKQLMQGYWASHAPPSASISVLDLESTPSESDPYANLATLVAPFCFAAVKVLFSQGQ